MEHQLENVIALRSSQDEVLWTIFGAFSAANGILFVALFTTGKAPSSPVGLVISIVGFVEAWVWYFIQRRALWRIHIYEQIIIKKIVPELWANASTFPLWKNLYEERGPLPGASSVMRFSVVSFGVAWLLLSIYFTIPLLF